MEIDKIAQLGERLDRWFDRNLPTFATQDHAAQGRAILRGVEIVKEARSVSKRRDWRRSGRCSRAGPQSTQQQRIASLIRVFEFGTRLADALHDELLDTEGEAKIWRLLDEIVMALDKTTSGRAALDVLFDSPDPGIRASAGAYLIDLMPERAVPMLREIDEKVHANSAHFTAAWAILGWELEGKSRFNYLSKSIGK